MENEKYSAIKKSLEDMWKFEEAKIKRDSLEYFLRHFISIDPTKKEKKNV